MHAFEKITIKKQDLCLSSERSIYWEQEKALVVSDLHIGKTGHFRKAGIAVPQSVFREDMQRLISLIQYFKPQKLIVVGDMFHSSANKELDLFKRWRADFESLEIKLVKGNHDILNRTWYAQSRIELFDSTLKISEFCFQHDPGECGKDGAGKNHYVFSGHIHPGITIHGSGKQTLKFPCFYFTDSFCILPAFSRFTGTVGVRLKDDDIAFAIVNNSIFRVN
jgi:uncharacterized protein